MLVRRVQLECNADEMEGKSTEAIAKLDLSFQRLSIAEESVVDHWVQLQCKVNELGGKSNEAIAELDLSNLRVEFA